jgi:hypothetical protein
MSNETVKSIASDREALDISRSGMTQAPLVAFRGWGRARALSLLYPVAAPLRRRRRTR